MQLMFSALMRGRLYDTCQRRAKPRDLVVDVASGEYPLITHLVFQRPDKQLVLLPWKSLRRIESAGRAIQITDINDGDNVTAEELEPLVMLKSDVMDALILDVRQRRISRANDLLLEEQRGTLRLLAAETGALAILRRMTRGKIAHNRVGERYDWADVEFLRGDIRAARRGEAYSRRIALLQPGEIAVLTDNLPYLHAVELLTLLPDLLAADTLEAMTDERQLQVFEELSEDQALRLLELMAPERVTDLLGRLEPERARQFLNHMLEERAAQVIELLRYPEDTVGGVMTNAVLSIPEACTVAEARQLMRDQHRQPDFAYFVYVVSDHVTRGLRGVISLRDMFLAHDTCQVGQIMKPHPVTLNPLEPAAMGAQRVVDSHLAALPVVGRDERLLGAVTVDTAVALLAPPSWSTQAPRVFS